METSEVKLPPCQVWFYLPRDLARPHDQRITQQYGWETLMESHHTAKFGDHRHCGSEGMFLVIEEQIPPLLFISKARAMSSSYRENFRMSRILTKIYQCVQRIESNPS